MWNIDQLALLSPNLKLGSQAVVNVLESRRSAAISKHIRCDTNDTSLRLRPADAIPGRNQVVDRRPTPQQVHLTPRWVPLSPVPVLNHLPVPVKHLQHDFVIGD